MVAQTAVGFKLIFREELIGRGLMRKVRVARAVLLHAYILVSGNRRFQVDEVSLTAITVSDAANRAVGAAQIRVLILFYGIHININLRSKIGLANANEVAQASKGHFRIAFAVAGNDHFDAPPDQFVDGEVLKMTAIGKVNVVPIFIGQPKQFQQQVHAVKGAVGVVPGIWKPPPQSKVEHR